MPAKMKSCKYCQEEISESVIKCKHCNSYQDQKYEWSGMRIKPRWFQTVFCTHCHKVSSPRTITKGSLMIEMVLWLTIFGGIIYSIWRHRTRYCTCRECGSDRINKIAK